MKVETHYGTTGEKMVKLSDHLAENTKVYFEGFELGKEAKEIFYQDEIRKLTTANEILAEKNYRLTAQLKELGEALIEEAAS